MKKLLVATRNKGKMKEIEALLDGLIDKVFSISDFPELPETVENGATFSENALKKARDAFNATGLAVIADDSGLIVESLDGRPGVFSARFAGTDADDSANNKKLLDELKAVPETCHKAAFICSLAYISEEGLEMIFEGILSGSIVEHPKGENGFGYDPLFLVDGYRQTMSELSIEEKNRISHRAQALKAFREYLADK